MNATVKRRADNLVATWTVTGDVPPSGGWQLSTTLVGGPDGPTHQFRVDFNGDELIATSIFDHEANQLFGLDAVPQRLGETWTVVFPIGDFPVASAGAWTARLTIGSTFTKTIDGSI